MSMIDWAKREVELALSRESENEEGFEYAKGCYESALKAYESICNDAHSGCSFSITRNILKMLLDENPLTPIFEADFPEEPYWVEKDGTKHYQCFRKSGLFKKEYPDGKVVYSDIDRYICVDIENTDNTYSSGMAGSIIDEMLPIRFPYNTSNKKYKVFEQTFLTDKKNGDFDTKAILRIKTPEGDIIDVKRYFTEGENHEWKEISETEYWNLEEKRIDTIEKKTRCRLIYKLCYDKNISDGWYNLREEEQMKICNRLDGLCKIFRCSKEWQFNTGSNLEAIIEQNNVYYQENMDKHSEIAELSGYIQRLKLILSTGKNNEENVKK